LSAWQTKHSFKYGSLTVLFATHLPQGSKTKLGDPNNFSERKVFTPAMRDINRAEACERLIY